MSDNRTIPKVEALWRVEWWDFTDHHDFVGRGARRYGHSYKKPDPLKHAQDFYAREMAEAHVRKLRKQVPAGELLVRVIPVPKPRSLIVIEQSLLPGEWPKRREGET
jgi:hypothetical protein